MSERALEIKRRLKAGEVVYSAWMTFNDSGIAEIMAGSGIDVLLIDTEHTSLSLEDLQHAMAAARRWDPVVIVRVQDHDPSRIKRILDIGADGIIAPMTMTADQTRALVAACKYPPAGCRGYGPRRATDYYRNTDAYVGSANEATFVIPQIEHVDAAARAAEIAAVPGVDAICVGPMDMSGSAGVLGNWHHPKVQAGLDQVFEASRAHNLAVCMGMYLPPEEQPAWVAKGARFVIASDDLTVLRTGVARDLAETRRRLSNAT